MNKQLRTEDVTSIVKRATDLLFVMNPKGTSMGVLFGVVLQMLANIFTPFLKQFPLLDFTSVNLFYCLCFGIFVFNLPAALRRHSLDPQIEASLAAIKKARNEGNLAPSQVKLLYIELINKAVAQIDGNMKVRQKAIAQISKGSTKLKE